MKSQLNYWYRLFLFFVAPVAGYSQNTGIGILSPLAPLHVKSGVSELVRLEAPGPYIGFYPGGVYKGYVWYGGDGMRMGSVGAGQRVVVSANYGPALSITPGGKFGIGNEDPGHPLEVSGIIGIRQDANNWSIAFNNSLNQLSEGELGFVSSNLFGFYNRTNGNGFLVNTASGNCVMGSGQPTDARLFLPGSGNESLKLSGAIKVSANSPAFELVAQPGNLYQYRSSAYNELVIDNVYCNNDPNAIILITALVFQNPVKYSLHYDAGVGRWKLSAERDYRAGNRVDIFRVDCNGTPNQPIGLMRAVPVAGFVAGDKFNVLVINQ